MHKTDLIICELCGETDTVPEDQDYCNYCFNSAPDEPYEKKPKSDGRCKVKPETKTYREYASQFGGGYLTGSIKQKDWAEKIRYSKLNSSELTDKERRQICTAEYATTAKFWIDKRFLDADCFKRRYCNNCMS